jgi:large subunit ribosomal protein L15
MGSGKGRYSGRGIKGQKSGRARTPCEPVRGRPDAGVHAHGQAARRDLEGRDADRPFRTSVWSLNVRDLARFDAGTDVTPELLKEAGLIRNLKRDVKVLGHGDLDVKLSVSAHCLLEGRGREDRSGRRKRHLAQAPARAEEAPSQEGSRPALSPLPPPSPAESEEAAVEAEPVADESTGETEESS